MENRRSYCVICGKEIIKGCTCSGNCAKTYMYFKYLSNSENEGSIFISGYCNFCGKTHELRTTSIRRFSKKVMLRHPQCYSRNQNLKNTYKEISSTKQGKKISIEALANLAYEMRKQKEEEERRREEEKEKRKQKEEEGRRREEEKEKRKQKEEEGRRREEEKEKRKQKEEEERRREEEKEKRRQKKEEERRRKEEKEKRRQKEMGERRTAKEVNAIISKINLERKESSHTLYDKERRFLICPVCGYYLVEYRHDTNVWYCNHCESLIDPIDSIMKYGLKFENKDKFAVYKFWGMDAVRSITYETEIEIELSIVSYFESCYTLEGANCLYSVYNKIPMDQSEVEQIQKLFEDKKIQCISLKNLIEDIVVNIDKLAKRIGKKKFSKLADEENELNLLAEIINQSLNEIDTYVIGFADSDIKKDQPVYYSTKYANIVIYSGNVGYNNCFAWNDAKRGGVVGVFPLRYSFFNDLIQSVIDNIKSFKSLIVESNFCYTDTGLYPLKDHELKALNYIRKSGEIYQNTLSKKMKIDSRKCSRIAIKLVGMKFIEREKLLSNGAYTYKLKYKPIMLGELSYLDDIISQLESFL